MLIGKAGKAENFYKSYVWKIKIKNCLKHLFQSFVMTIYYKNGNKLNKKKKRY